MTGEDKVIMYFAKNNLAMEKAAEIPKEELDGAVLFPAFATKNQIVEVNFGQLVRALSIKIVYLHFYSMCECRSLSVYNWISSCHPFVLDMGIWKALDRLVC